MSISTLRDEFQEHLADFLWSQWGQMGMSASTRRRDNWAADPEALLLLTFEVGRGEPRLLDEVLDWMLVNERLISVQRLRNLAVDDADRALVEAALGWLGENRRRSRLRAKAGPEREPEPFFRGSRLRVTKSDPAFLAQGFRKPQSAPSGKSRAPDLNLLINFAFRLRLLLGVGVRAEVARVLLTVEAPWMNVQALSADTAYTKRNVQEATSALASAGLATSWVVGNENRYEVDRARGIEFVGSAELPRHEDWPQLFRAYRAILRWLVDPANQNLSDYMLLSGARTLLEEVAADLRFAGVPLDLDTATRDLANIETAVREVLSVVSSIL